MFVVGVSPLIKTGEIWKTRFKKIRQLRKYSPIPRQAIDDHKEEMAFWRKFVVEDRIEVVGNLILHPFINTFNEDSPTDFGCKLIIAAQPEDQRIPMCAPKEIIKVQINREFVKKVDSTRETCKTDLNSSRRVPKRLRTDSCPQGA